MADQHRAGCQAADDRGEMLYDVVDSPVSNRIWIGSGKFDGLSITRPTRRENAVARLLEHGLPRHPGTLVQPETVDEYDGMRFVRHLTWPFVISVHLIRLYRAQRMATAMSPASVIRLNLRCAGQKAPSWLHSAARWKEAAVDGEFPAATFAVRSPARIRTRPATSSGRLNRRRRCGLTLRKH